MKLIRTLVSTATLLIGIAAVGSAQASLTPFRVITGNLGESSDGCGSTTQTCGLTANVIAGSTIVAAYLYTSTYGSASIASLGGTFGGTGVTYTALGANNAGLQAGRADVTSIVAAAVGASGGAFNFTYTETSVLQDGAALVVVYSNATLATTTVGILDGFSATTGDSTSIAFGSPLNPLAPGFMADMRLGIGFSYDGNNCLSGNQVSQVDVNGIRITNNAGCNDDSRDAVAANGNLITVGGDNDPYSPLLPTIAQDHERYNLAAQIASGDTSINIRTLNPSNDDNIFLALFHVTGQANVCTVRCSVPEPATLGLTGLALAALGLQRRQRKAAPERASA